MLDLALAGCELPALLLTDLLGFSRSLPRNLCLDVDVAISLTLSSQSDLGKGRLYGSSRMGDHALEVFNWLWQMAAAGALGPHVLEGKAEDAATSTPHAYHHHIPSGSVGVTAAAVCHGII